ncbi:putative phytosulfokines 6 [Euphorbia lathyris]|uniref:putative phytosulfokines 6 n=1 Tax=Euphorbia lathyris TaxID=212925 RepID=UPI003313E118
MKKNSFFCLLISLLILSSLVSSARLLQDDKKMNKDDDEITQLTQDFSQLMGLEGCEGGDEECLKRRMVAEAHLDYIYTQSHKKP